VRRNKSGDDTYSEERALSLGLKPLPLSKVTPMLHRSQNGSTTSPSKALPKALDKAELLWRCGVFQFNEAFAVVGLANLKY
jgi:acetyl-CoA C-acetyltransferase